MRSFVSLAMIALVGMCLSSPTAGQADPQARQPATRITKLAQGVRIDWSIPAVEVEAEVVLREGPLELSACTPGTREHESILVVRGKPTHVFQAMGMIGLTPGKPISYDEKQQRILPATGSSVEVLVKYRKQNRDHLVPAATWMARAETDKPIGDMRWVFAGSRRVDKTTLGAELDGTVVCVVNFETALIAVDSLHTADNEELWLVAHTEAIPPVGTPCTLVLRAPAVTELLAKLNADGFFQFENRRLDAKHLAALWIDRRTGNHAVRITLETSPGVEAGASKEAVELLVEHGVARDAIRIRNASGASQSGGKKDGG